MKKRRTKSKRRDRRQAALPFARAAKVRRRSCGCAKRCCAAGGVKCACRCHGRNHGQKAVYRNPPAKPAGRIAVNVLGLVKSIDYIRAGKRWRHTVEGRARLLVPKSGNYIAIDGIRASRFLEG